MTDPAIISASYAAERNYSHNLDDVNDASDAVGAWGTAKESTTKLVDLSGNGNVADIHGPMPTEGFIQGRRFDGDDDYLDCENDSSLKPTSFKIITILRRNNNYGVRNTIIDVDTPRTSGYGYSIEFDTDDILNLRVRDLSDGY